MFSHIFLGVDDFERALDFYSPLMDALGLGQRFVDTQRPWAGWESAPGSRPLFLIGRPYDGRPSSPGNGNMVAFSAATREQVDSAYAVALSRGGASEGAPGFRPHYHASYYGAYLRDPEGNKICVVCHAADMPC
ncbi:MAG: VOC family protein [Pseudomonadota bacterium]